MPERIKLNLTKRCKAWGVAAFLLMACAGLCGCDAIYRLLDREGAEEKELVGEYVPFEDNEAVRDVQTLLKLYGYNPGRVDGVLGVKTRDAIEEFQKDNHLKQTRFIDKDTWGRLRRFIDNGFIEDYRLNIRQVQTTLREAGFDPGKVDGKFGPKTQKAVKDFQQANGLKVDGKVGFNTMSKLSAYIPAQPAE